MIEHAPMTPDEEFPPLSRVELKPDIHPVVWEGIRDRFEYGKHYVVVTVKDPMIYVVDAAIVDSAGTNHALSELTKFDPETDIGSDKFRFVKSIGLNSMRRVRT